MKRNLNKFAAALLFASAVITCSLTMWATHAWTGRRHLESERRQKLARQFLAGDGGRCATKGLLRPCVGEPRVDTSFPIR